MIKILCVGKIKDKHLTCLIEDYLASIAHYHKIEVQEVKDEPIGSNNQLVLQKEGQRLIDRINSDEYVVLIDLHGKALDSIEFSKKIDQLFVNHSKLCFVIGGSLGFADEVLLRANERIKLSDLTFTHQMARLILLEQIYRSFKIINNETYHK